MYKWKTKYIKQILKKKTKEENNSLKFEFYKGRGKLIKTLIIFLAILEGRVTLGSIHGWKDIERWCHTSYFTNITLMWMYGLVWKKHIRLKFLISLDKWNFFGIKKGVKKSFKTEKQNWFWWLTCWFGQL